MWERIRACAGTVLTWSRNNLQIACPNLAEQLQNARFYHVNRPQQYVTRRVAKKGICNQLTKFELWKACCNRTAHAIILCNVLMLYMQVGIRVHVSAHLLDRHTDPTTHPPIRHKLGK